MVTKGERWREREKERDKGKERKIGRGVQITNTKNVREDVGIDLTDNKKKIIREYCKQLYAHTFNNLENCIILLEKPKLPKLSKVK